MNRILIMLSLITMLTGCFNEPMFEENEDITKYALDKYSEKLIMEKVKFLKCYPGKDGNMKVVYTTVSRDNSFPSTIRFDYVNKTYNVYFDNAYLNGPKKDLINDIDLCVAEWEKLNIAKKTWK